ncbi:MAG TPA: nitrate reductase [Gammaproteobacteria bacterium]|nr:nitrate reductase [Gammaproteobacteria bacterium]
MTLLELARGPALQVSLIVLVLGVVWRLAGLLLLPYKKDLSEPRQGGGSALGGAAYTIIRRFWPHREVQDRVLFSHVMGYAFHIGLAVVVFGYTQHILFIRDVTGLSWPALPNWVVYLAGAITIGALVALLVRRLGHGVLRLLSGVDDYLSWLVTILPVITGFLAVAHFGARYETLLAVHLLTVELLLIWLPFGKLMHTFTFVFSRGFLGARAAHKGAQT